MLHNIFDRMMGSLVKTFDRYSKKLNSLSTRVETGKNPPMSSEESRLVNSEQELLDLFGQALLSEPIVTSTRVDVLDTYLAMGLLDSLKGPALNSEDSDWGVVFSNTLPIVFGDYQKKDELMTLFPALDKF